MEPKHYEVKYAALEALLFYYGEPMELKRIAKFLGMDEKSAEGLLIEFGEVLGKDEHRGLLLLRNGNVFQLGTKPEFRTFGEALAQEEFREELTPAAVETLSIIAYLGPVTRSTIDFIRGVNSSFILRSLLMRGLVTRAPHERKKNVFEYSASFDFLRHMGIESPGALPEYDRYRHILEEFGVTAAAQEESVLSQETSPAEPPSSE